MRLGGARARLAAALGRVAHSRRAELVSGVLLMVTGILEIVDTDLERALGMDIGIHHGAIFYGFLQAARGVTSFLAEEVDAVLKLAGASREEPAPGAATPDAGRNEGRRADA